MFTGIITAVGRIRETRSAAGGVRMVIDAGGLGIDDVVPGDSIAVNGVCLTAVALDGGSFTVDVSRETLSCTAGFTEGAEVNLEKALRLADRLGGHLVSGHVDGVGEVLRVEMLGDNRQLVFAVPHALSRYVARKGSVAVNGVSLTVNAVEGDDFAVNLIPHTLASTNLRTLQAGDRVNIEVDMLARYIERMQEHAAGQ
jgi:riboflavin synthase